MDTDGKDFNPSDHVPQAEENQASGPWGAVLTSREEEGWVSSSVKPRIWERGPHPLHPEWRVPPTWSGVYTVALKELEPCIAKVLLVCLGV